MQEIDLEIIARGVHGRVEFDDDGQPSLVRAPAPGCGRDDNSLAIWLYEAMSWVHCHRPEHSWQACQAYVRKRVGLPAWKPRRARASSIAIKRGHQKQSAKRKFIRAMWRKVHPSLSQRQPWKALGMSRQRPALDCRQRCGSGLSRREHGPLYHERRRDIGPCISRRRGRAASQARRRPASRRMNDLLPRQPPKEVLCVPSRNTTREIELRGFR